MLQELAITISVQTSNLTELVSIGKSLKGEKDPESLTRNGAKLLKLIEPLLESLVPSKVIKKLCLIPKMHRFLKVSQCATNDSSSLIISLTDMASQLDLLATGLNSKKNSPSLHKSATALQLAAWIMAQLQSSVHSFYKVGTIRKYV